MTTAAQNQSQGAEAAAAERRRKRKERGAKNGALEPKNIVSGAGQPLDPGVRRELEEQLGHDLSRVRLHTDRDAGRLADLMGADALAVGQNIFFREGTFQPGTQEGQRLLAHELLHTIQNPHGSGALQAGREPGAVSLPQEAIEREAETAAQELTSAESSATAAPEVEAGQATPGWLRYTHVDADRNRLEQLDPATLVDRLANAVVRSLHGDPEDRSKRARLQLGALSEELQDQVYERLENRLLSTELDRLIELVDGADAEEFYDGDGPEQSPLGAPFVEPDAAEEILRDRENEQRDGEKEQARDERPAEAPAPEGKERTEEAPGSAKPRPVEGREPAPVPGQDQQRPPESGREETEEPGGGNHAPNPGQQEGGQAPEGPGTEGPGTEAGSGAGSGESEQDGGDSASAGKDQQGGGKDGAAADEKSGGAAEEKKDAEGKDGDKGDEKDGGGGKEEDAGGGEQEEAPAASEEESAAKNRPGVAEALVESQKLPAEDKKAADDKPTGSPSFSGKPDLDAAKRSLLDGQRSQDLDPEEKEPGPAQGGDSEVEVGGGEKSAWDTKLQPEDFVPEKDLDVSGVPTADKLDPAAGGAEPAMPSFPAPPPTKAEKVQAERDAEDAEEEAEPEAEEESQGPALPDASLETEGSPEAGLGLNAVDRASGPKPGSGLAGAPPKTGEDEKAEPAAARAAEQEAKGKKEAEAASEEAAKEGKGAGKDKEGAKGEGESQKAGGSKSAEGKASSAEEKKDGEGAKDSGTDAGKKEETAPEEKNGATDDDKSPSAGRDSQVTGGSNADVPGQSSGSGNSDGSGSGSSSSDGSSGASSGSSGSTSGGSTQTEKSSSKPDSAASGSPKSAPEPGKKTAGRVSNANSSAPKAEAPAPKAAKSAPKPGGKPAGKGAAPKRGGGGGAKGAPAKAKKDSAAAPNLSQVAPEAGLSQAAKLKPHRAMEAMGGISASVDRTVGDEHKQLSAAPPSMTRPAGSPQTLQGAPRTDAPAQYNQDAVQKSEAPKAEEAKVEGAKLPDKDFDPGKNSDGKDLDAVETEDPSIAQAEAGTAPGVEMQDAADETAKAQNEAVDAKTRETLATGRQDAARGMGEDQIFPDVPKTVMESKVPGPRGGKGGGAKTSVNTGAVPVEAASEVAEHEKGPELQQAFAQGQKDMGGAKEKKDGEFRDTQSKHKQQVDKEIATNSDQQSGERQKAMADVTGQREQWRAEQDAEVKKLGDKKSEKHKKARQEVKDKEAETDEKTAKEKDVSDRKIRDEKKRAREEAKKKQQEEKKKKDDAPLWKKAFDFIVDLFNDLVDAITKLVEKAFTAVTGFINDFAKAVGGWINDARKWIADKVTKFVDAVVDFVKSAVQAVVDLAKKIGEAIVSVVKAAIDFVQKLATALMEAVGDLLDALGKALSAALDFLGKALSAVVDAVVSGIKAIVDFAKNLLLALGEWMLIAADFLSDPGGWLSGAKNSAEDGAKNHLFNEVSSAVKQWFKEKIQEILGVPKAIIDKLVKGGMSLDDMVKEAWEAVVPQLPLIIGELVMTKVVAKLIPGAGWAIAVIDAIRTAWGALSAILSSLQAVLAWLKAVRQGGAGLLFAKAVAAGVVALLEVLYQALLSGIGKYVSKVGNRLKGVADNMGKDKGKDDKPGGDKGAQGDDPKDKDKEKDKDQPGPGKDKDKDEKGQGDKDKGSGGKGDKGQQGTPGKGKDGSKNNTGPGGKDAKGSGGKDKGADSKGKDDDKKDTSPTPTPKPKPKPDPPAKPKPDTETKPKPDKDSGKDSSKEDNDKKNDKDSSTDPKKDKTDESKDGKGDGKKDSDKDKDGKDNKPKGKKKDKHKKDKDSKGKKDKHGKDGKSKEDRKKEKQEEKDKRKKEEESKESKDERLRKIVARIRPRIEAMLRKGIKHPLFKAALTGMRALYRLSALEAEGGESFGIIARLNPTAEVAKGLKMDTVELVDAIDAMVAHILRSGAITSQAARVRPPPGQPSGAQPGLKADPNTGTAAIARSLFDNPLQKNQKESLDLMAGDSEVDAHLAVERTNDFAGAYLTKAGHKRGPTYGQEARSLRAGGRDGQTMGGLILDAAGGNRAGWQGGTKFDNESLNRAALAATLLGVIEPLRTPFVMVPNLATVDVSHRGGLHIADTIGTTPLSGGPVRPGSKRTKGDYGDDTTGAQEAGRQTEWLLASLRAMGAPTYFDTSQGLSTSTSIGTGYLSRTPTAPNDQMGQLQALSKQFDISGKIIQQAHGLEVNPNLNRNNPRLWESVGESMSTGSSAQMTPSPAAEVVLQRTADNMKLWADTMKLDYSKDQASKAKGDFLVKIYKEFTNILNIPADPSFEARLRSR
ncbi:DUF4157 domain-containing protein [Streptomyces sp. NA04227]|uniref:eCIS core domain-containing protein n=1 Tax=Streptomyces sp. NA04227 TaxID=2742136 RepID=UPI001591A994|nr:DUF4157 domain-containing protein [Streptomyces sp. NA04227]QKW08717.1 DUF4157 domain-containing protein [Streptomyces sp. NA04227]